MNPTDPTPHTKRKWEDRFLEALEREGSVSHACKAVGIHRSTAYQRRKESDEFAERWNEIDESLTDILERSAMNRAIYGYDREVYYEGAQCGTQKVYETRLTEKMLSSRRRERYGDKPETSGDVQELKRRVMAALDEMEEDLSGEGGDDGGNEKDG